MDWKPTLSVNGVIYKLPGWLDVGTSFFIPCLSPQKVMPAIRGHYKQHNYKLVYAEWVEGGTFGVRVWRV